MAGSDFGFPHFQGQAGGALPNSSASLRARTRSVFVGGVESTHTPDVRYNFWVGQAALRSKSWKNLEWIPESFKSLFLTLLKLVATELPQLTDEDWEPRGSLGANILAGAAETWAGSRLRNSLHTNTGSCAEHTDYGVIQVGAFLSILSRGWG